MISFQYFASLSISFSLILLVFTYDMFIVFHISKEQVLNEKHYVFRWKIFVMSWMFGLCAIRSSRMSAHCFMQTEVLCSWCRENGWKKVQSQLPKNPPPHYYASPVLTSTTTFDLLAASVLRNTPPDPRQKLVSTGSL